MRIKIEKSFSISFIISTSSLGPTPIPRIWIFGICQRAMFSKANGDAPSWELPDASRYAGGGSLFSVHLVFNQPAVKPAGLDRFFP